MILNINQNANVLRVFKIKYFITEKLPVYFLCMILQYEWKGVLERNGAEEKLFCSTGGHHLPRFCRSELFPFTAKIKIRENFQYTLNLILQDLEVERRSDERRLAR